MVVSTWTPEATELSRQLAIELGQLPKEKHMTTTELVPIAESAPPTLFGTNNAMTIVERATEQANALAGVITDKHLYADISGRRHVTVEGWTLLGTMLGVFPVCTWTRLIENGWEARVEARTLNGQVVGASEAQCTHDEKTWATRDEFALRSMAQTRATSKALRLPLGFVMVLAGYEATPAEEMPRDEVQAPPRPLTPPPAPAARPQVVDATSRVLDGPLPTQSEVLCRFCNGAVWDNRSKKANGEYAESRPDFSCKDKTACDSAAWIQDDGGLRWQKGNPR